MFGNCLDVEEETVVEDDDEETVECLSTDIFGNCTEYAEPQV
jgi:hypothetical protein